MANSVTVTGVASDNRGTGKQTVLMDVNIDGTEYKWMDYTDILSGEDLQAHVESKLSEYIADIQAKEVTWAEKPSTGEVVKPGGMGMEGAAIEEVELTKEDVVKPTPNAPLDLEGRVAALEAAVAALQAG